jgi:hypothetical protein
MLKELADTYNVGRATISRLGMAAHFVISVPRRTRYRSRTLGFWGAITLLYRAVGTHPRNM